MFTLKKMGFTGVVIVSCCLSVNVDSDNVQLQNMGNILDKNSQGNSENPSNLQNNDPFGDFTLHSPQNSLSNLLSASSNCNNSSAGNIASGDETNFYPLQDDPSSNSIFDFYTTYFQLSHNFWAGFRPILYSTTSYDKLALEPIENNSFFKADPNLTAALDPSDFVALNTSCGGTSTLASGLASVGPGSGGGSSSQGFSNNSGGSGGGGGGSGSGAVPNTLTGISGGSGLVPNVGSIPLDPVPTPVTPIPTPSIVVPEPPTYLFLGTILALPLYRVYRKSQILR